MSTTNRRVSHAWVNYLLLAYVGVILALTLCKRWYRIGYLWRPENQEHRSLELIPFEQIWTSTTWFSPIFDLVGNVLLFLPLGFLLSCRIQWSLRKIIMVGAAFSFAIEISQFILGAGRTDTDDFLLNTVGTALGALFHQRFASPTIQKITLGIIALAVCSFLLMVGLSPIFYPADQFPIRPIPPR
ncbi:VanZ family protein [Corynebacterium sp. 3HC-13]|uniref:VanZ family protein n=1 Tax=Corynebacterium poyangense TaxID=2684405 RepID=UPI001CCC47D2|nr:VanZ family protein [Corynebacterium poyangense]MBZ8177241.1 VanZ family protein [Corynebacterium poyangense]